MKIVKEENSFRTRKISKTLIKDYNYISRKIKIFPNKYEKNKLKQWFGIYRYIYNQSVSFNNENKINIKDTLSTLRNKFVKDNNYISEKTWVKKLPADTRDYAVKEFKTNLSTNLKKKIKFEMKFKSKKVSTCTIEIRRRQFNTLSGNYSFLKNIKTRETIPELISDFKIQMTPLGDFYFIIPMEANIVENQDNKRIISLDPGVRTFLTGYSSDGYIFHIGENDIGRLARLQHYKFKLQKFGRRKLKARLRLQRNIKNLVLELHKKSTKFLHDNFDIIICPKLDTTQLCRQKKLSRKVKNKLRILSHCAFIERMKMKNNYKKKIKLIIPTEEFTSKTCCNCGNLHKSLGMSKTYHCKKCEKTFDRDVNAALNILLKTITNRAC